MGRPWLLDALLPLVLCAGLTLVAYGSSLGAGLMFDAAIDLPRATDRSWLAVLTSAGASTYYRPVTLLIWKALHLAFGRNDGVALHALSLASHIMCGWLVYQLGLRLLDRWAAFAAAALFTWFLLSYQVVAFVDSVFHSLATMFLLAAAVLYWDARTRASRWRLAAAVASAGLALFTHESAVALLVIVPVLEVLLARKLGRWQWWPVLFWAVGAAYGAAWLAAPKFPSHIHLVAADIRLNGLYFAQGLSAPVAMLARNLNLVAVCACTVAALLTIAAIRRRLAPALLAALWFVGATLPACLFLPWPNYVIDAPRLLYVASPGIALLWATALAPASWLTAVGGLAIVGLLVQSFGFVAKRERLIDQGGDVVRQLVHTAMQPGPDAGRVYVNVPAFIGPKLEELPLGHFGVTMLPDYFGLDLDVAAATGQHLPIRSVAYADLLQPWGDAYAPQTRPTDLAAVDAAIRQGGGVYLTHFLPGRISLDFAGSLGHEAGQPTAVVARFGDWAVLEEAQAERAGQQVHLRLVWRALAPAPGDYTIFVHAIGDSAQPVAQADGYAIGNMLPANRWQPGDLIRDERTIDLPVSPRVTSVLIGLYDRADPNRRAPATDSDGRSLPGDGASITVPAS